ncbi:MAG: hypothetical protein J6M26_05900 [Clostridia bacterium]|nr:hypothetical protein [Clostridia bacterium]
MKTLKLHELKDQLEEILDLVENDEGQEENIDKNTVYLDGVSTPESQEEEMVVAENQSADDENEGEIPEDNKTEIEGEEQSKPKKFKSVEELEKAYESLEKEFTRRSQRLAKLEKEMKQDKVETDAEWKAKVDKFFSENPSAKPFAKQMSDEIIRDNTLRGRSDCLEIALTRVLLEAYRAPKDLATDEDFLKEHILGSDFVKKAVIEGYMKDLREGKPPVLISARGQNTVAPRSKPKTIEEAGKMFRQNNR